MNCNNRRIFGLNYRKKRQKLVIRSTSMWIVKFRTMIWYKLGNSTEFKPSFASWWAMFTPALRLDFFRGIYTRETLAIKFPLRPVCDFTEFPSRCRLFFSFSSRSPRRRHVRHCVSGQPLLIVLPNFTGSTLWGFVLVDCHRWFFFQDLINLELFLWQVLPNFLFSRPLRSVRHDMVLPVFTGSKRES